MEQVVCWLSANLPEDSIITNGAGNYAAFVHRYFRFKRARTQIAPTSGSMGYGLPAAIAAKKTATPDPPTRAGSSSVWRRYLSISWFSRRA